MKLQTQYWRIDPVCPEKETIAKAAALIKIQELVAFPTETVYGLGAAAFQAQAVEKIFRAKGRAEANPLLVHLSSIEQAAMLAEAIPPPAEMLMERFWPGPLSIILPSRKKLPSIVLGGKASVGLRMPSHPVALALIDQTGPLAAPSANLSGRPSPISAEHVRADLDGRIAAVLDAGPTGLGLESTIIDLSNSVYRVLRQGGIAVEELEEALGRTVLVNKLEQEKFPHHQIKADLLLCPNWDEMDGYLSEKRPERKIALVYAYIGKKDAHWGEIIEKYPQYQSYKLDLNTAINRLYPLLREADDKGFEYLLFAPLPEKAGGIAQVIIERIYQAAKRFPY